MTLLEHTYARCCWLENLGSANACRRSCSTANWQQTLMRAAYCVTLGFGVFRTLIRLFAMEMIRHRGAWSDGNKGPSNEL